MPRRRTLTERQVHHLPRKSRRYNLPDPMQPHLFLRVPVSGPITYCAVARRRKTVEGGRLVWKTLGTSAYLSLDEARALCRDAVKRIRFGEPLKDVQQRDSVAEVCDRWLQIVVKGGGFRTARDRERIIKNYIVPALGDRVFVTVRRSDIAKMLDSIAERNGKAQADMVLKIFAAVANWWAKRDDDYRSPIVAGMKRDDAGSRDRVLSDAEVRRIWQIAERFGAAGGFVQFALLCAQRYRKIVDLCWSDLDGDTWHIRQAPREKQNAGSLKLPPLALEIIRRQPRIAGKDRIFGRPLGVTLARMREEAGVADWVVHDLRRTARTLMSRAQVPSEISELVLGHSLRGVRQVYDRFQYDEQKGLALAALARLIENILATPDRKVVAFGGKR
jgi:integrase